MKVQRFVDLIFEKVSYFAGRFVMTVLAQTVWLGSVLVAIVTMAVG